MKTLKYLFFLLLIITIGFCVYVAVQPNSFEISRTRIIKAPAAVIYNNVIDFKNWESWSSWAEADDDMKIFLSEQTKGVDGSYSWEDKDGVGYMKTLLTTPNESIEQEMQFSDFPSSEVNWHFDMHEAGSTNVTWQISGKDLPFSFKLFSMISGGMESQIAPHFERSLEKLDSIVVNSMKAFSISIDGITEYGGGFYLFKTTSASNSNISELMGKQYGELMTYMNQNNMIPNGMPFTIYNEMNENGNIIMSNAIPVRDRVIVTGTFDILCGYMPKTKVLKTTLKGNYSNLGQAWEESMLYLKENNFIQSNLKPFEVYTNDPGMNPNPADWITEIYIPID
jgi:effector-binding domain-containing protein/ribosome-associated toxin RatA of RatAB toxin-antitoxin module